MGRPQRGWNTPVNRASETDDLRQRKPVQEGSEAPDPYADQRKWPAWMVTIAVIAFCGAFWAGVSYLVSLLLG
ncbi:MAG: hypothetical protein EON93_11570 [Burkholderiales bacterium]|nr:MAG: hypothetical protein EON93_11570 [Burkholderiales bacterium]